MPDNAGRNGSNGFLRECDEKMLRFPRRSKMTVQEVLGGRDLLWQGCNKNVKPPRSRATLRKGPAARRRLKGKGQSLGRVPKRKKTPRAT